MTSQANVFKHVHIARKINGTHKIQIQTIILDKRKTIKISEKNKINAEKLRNIFQIQYRTISKLTGKLQTNFRFYFFRNKIKIKEPFELKRVKQFKTQTI